MHLIPASNHCIVHYLNPNNFYGNPETTKSKTRKVPRTSTSLQGAYGHNDPYRSLKSL